MKLTATKGYNMELLKILNSIGRRQKKKNKQQNKWKLQQDDRLMFTQIYIYIQDMLLTPQ